MKIRQALENYIYYRNQMDMQKLINQNDSFNNHFINDNFNHIVKRYNHYDSSNSYNNSTTQNSNVYTFPWIDDIIKILTSYKPDHGNYYTNYKPKVDLFKPLTKGDDVQFKQFTGLNPNQMSYYNLVEHKMINPFTRQPWPQFVSKIKPVYDGFSMLPTHYSLTPDMKRKMTFTMAEREGFRGYNQY